VNAVRTDEHVGHFGGSVAETRLQLAAVIFEPFNGPPEADMDSLRRPTK
jgi:hypothetical protein